MIDNDNVSRIRKKNRRKFLKITGATLAGTSTSLIAGCTGERSGSGNVDDDTTTLKILTDHSSPDIQNTLRNAFDEWASTIDEDVQADFLFRGFDEVVQTLQRNFETGNPPDIAFLNSEWAWRFGSEGLLADLSDVLPDSISENHRVDVDGESLFWPHDIGVMTMWYRADVYDDAGIEPPSTWDDHIKNLEVLDAHLEGNQMDPILTFANPNVGVTQYNYDADMMMNGVKYFSNEGGEISVVLDQEPNRERAIEVLEYLQKQYQYSPDSTSYEWGDMVELYVTEQVATTWYTGRPIRQSLERDFDGLGQWTTPAPWPVPSRVVEGQGEYQTYMTVGGFFAPKEAENTELAKSFISYYMSTDWYVESALSVPLHIVPPNTDVMDREAYQSHPFVQARPDVVDYYQEYAQYGVFPTMRNDPPIPFFGDITMFTYIIPTMMATAMTNRVNPGDAVDIAAQELREVLPDFQK